MTSAKFPPPGSLKDIGGYRLHAQVKGSGQPAVVMDSGLGATSFLFERVLPQVATFTTACAFDRAGYAWSDPAPAGVPRTSQQLVSEQRQLMQALGLQPPYVLLGASFGAINSLLYAKLFPDEVAGLVLADPSHPEMFERIPGLPGLKSMQVMADTMGFLARIRLVGPWQRPLWRKSIPNWQAFPADVWAAQEYFNAQPTIYDTLGRESRDGAASFRQVREAGYDYGDLPLIVLTGGGMWKSPGRHGGLSERAKQIGLQLRDEMAAWSTRGEHRIVDGATHMITLDGVAAVVQAVRDVVELARTDTTA
jgi:pimeloyl-ACP methyl ester carboxylesterase